MAPTYLPLPLSFAVPSRDICVICLERSSEVKICSFKKVSNYLGLDVREIFNIKKNLALEQEEVEGDDVNIDVILCGACDEIVKKFDETYQEFVKLRGQLHSNLARIQKVMVVAEGDVGKVKQLQSVTGIGRGNGKAPVKSISEKFRKETMNKLFIRVGKVEPNTKVEIKIEKGPVDLHCNEKVEELSVSDPGDKHDEFEVFLQGLEGTEADKEPNSDDEMFADEDDYMSEEDDDDDLEARMLKYDRMGRGQRQIRKPPPLAPISSLGEGGGSGEGQLNISENELMQTDGTDGDMEFEDGMDEEKIIQMLEGDAINSTDFNFVPEEPTLNKNDNNSKLKLNTATARSPTPSATATTSKPFNSFRKLSPTKKVSCYKCDICGKVVVGLKNSEIHQRRHSGEKPFECEHCFKTFRDTSNLRSHTLRFHRELVFVLYKDKDVTLNQFKKGLDHLITSIITVTKNDKDFVNNSSTTITTHGCQLCPRKYTQRYAIEDHVVQRHYDVLAVTLQSLQKEIETFSVDECLYYMSEMDKSRNTTTRCGFCGENFQTPDDLNIHVKLHIRVILPRNKDSPPSMFSNVKSIINVRPKCGDCNTYFDDLNQFHGHKTGKGECTTISTAKRYNNEPQGSNITNSNVALFKCKYCGKCLNSINTRRQHVLFLHRFELFAKYMPPGTTPAEVDTAFLALFQQRHPDEPEEPIFGKDGRLSCFKCRKVLSEFRKLKFHVMSCHFEDVKQFIRKEILSRRTGQKSGVIEVIEIDAKDIIEIVKEDGEEEEIGDEDDALPKILKVLDTNGEEMTVENGIRSLEVPYGNDVEEDYKDLSDFDVKNGRAKPFEWWKYQ